MSKKDSDQTLITKDDERLWRRVLHGEMESVEDDDEYIDAAIIRNYLIARDEVLAVSSINDSKDLNTISEEEARLIYHRASEEIRLRGRSVWLDYLKTYGSGALIGGLFTTVVFLLYFPDKAPPSSVEQASRLNKGLNFSDYPAMQFNEKPGDFPNMLLIPGGITTIGCAKGWDDASGGCRPSEFPPHLVSINTFEISQHEVTVGQFLKFINSTQYVTDAEKDGRGCVHEDLSKPGHPFVMNANLNWHTPGYTQNDSYPVTCVSWHDAQNYVDWLSSETNTDYRLPTETEWEHAARGGQVTAYFWGSVASNDQANYAGTGGKDKWPFASPVGQFPANKYAVQDTSGNLWEWVQDCWHDTYSNAPVDGKAWDEDCKDPSFRVRRGGAWDVNGAGIRSAIRSRGSKHDRSNLYGFRVARDWQQKEK